jgi:cell filamentation protein
MSLVHMVLCYRAGFSIDWSKADRADYLTALTREIEEPRSRVLDNYQLQFKVDRLDREHWRDSVEIH